MHSYVRTYCTYICALDLNPKLQNRKMKQTTARSKRFKIQPTQQLWRWSRNQSSARVGSPAEPVADLTASLFVAEDNHSVTFPRTRERRRQEAELAGDDHLQFVYAVIVQ